jgi:hypothetical protein
MTHSLPTQEPFGDAATAALESICFGVRGAASPSRVSAVVPWRQAGFGLLTSSHSHAVAISRFAVLPLLFVDASVDGSIFSLKVKKIYAWIELIMYDAYAYNDLLIVSVQRLKSKLPGCL